MIGGGEPVTKLELDRFKSLPDQGIFSISHRAVADMIEDYFEKNTVFNIRDTFHAVYHGGYRYAGLFQLNASPYDVDWLVAATNANDGRGSLVIHTGCVLRDFRCTLSFNHSRKVMKKYTYISPDELKALVNESLVESKDYYAVESDRMDHYQKTKLSAELAHHTICRLIETEVVAGRLAAEFINRWNNPEDYIKPRNVRSLFTLASFMLNRLRTSELIERTQTLHDFFDDVAKFNKKPTTWIQTRFA